jgi:cytidylate kinase
MGVVTVSRQMASEGCEIAAGVASILGFRFIDREIIHRAAEEVGVPKIALDEIAYEGRRNIVERILQAVNMMPPIPATAEAWRREAAASIAHPFGGIFSLAVPPFAVTLKDYVQMMEMVIRNLAQEGKVVLVGRGGQVLLQDMPQALHVQIVAPFPSRVATLVEREGIEEGEAAAKLRASDKARKDYLWRYHRVDWLDPTLYDLVINTAKVPCSLVVDLIVNTYRELQGLDDE